VEDVTEVLVIKKKKNSEGGGGSVDEHGNRDSTEGRLGSRIKPGDKKTNWGKIVEMDRRTRRGRTRERIREEKTIKEYG